MHGYIPLVRNSVRGTKPYYKFMMIIPLFVIDLKAISNGNLTNDFFGGRNLALFLDAVQCNTNSRPIIFHYPVNTSI